MLNMTIDDDIKFGNAGVNLNDAPIRAAWILEGKPVARNKVLSTSADGTATTLIWDCSPGRFNWFYSIDETLYVLEGSVTLKDPAGNSRLVGPGDTIFFPAGSQAEWTVHSHIRKIAFCRTALPKPAVWALRFRRRLKKIFAGNGQGAGGPAMFGNS